MKNTNPGDKAAFNVRMNGIRAFIQAKGATTSRSKIADKQVTVDTIAVSARPVLNIMDLRTGRKNMADLIREANVEINNTKLGHIQNVLTAGISTYASPYYAAGAGVVQATFDAMLTHWSRLGGGVAILGDVAALDKLAELTGFKASDTVKQYSPNMMDDYHRNGVIGGYKGSNVIRMPNVYLEDGVTTMIDPSFLYMLPVSASADNRNLKVVNEGPVFATEAQNIDDLTYEVRLDQWFGAAFLVGKHPNLGVYCDNTL